MAKRPTIAERRARLSARVALAVAARDAARRAAAKRAQAALKLARHEAAVALRRDAEKARRDADPEHFHAKAKRYRDSHPDIEAARHARFYAAKKARAIEAAAALAVRLERKAQRKAKSKAHAKAYQAAYYRSHRGLCQPSPRHANGPGGTSALGPQSRKHASLSARHFCTRKGVLHQMAGF